MSQNKVTVFQLEKDAWDDLLVRRLSDSTNYASSIVLFMLIREACEYGSRYITKDNAAQEKYIDWLTSFVKPYINLEKDVVWKYMTPVVLSDFYFRPAVLEAYERVAKHFEETLKSLESHYSFVSYPVRGGIVFLRGNEKHVGSVMLQTYPDINTASVGLVSFYLANTGFGYVKHPLLCRLFSLAQSRLQDWQQWLNEILEIPSIFEVASMRKEPDYEFEAITRYAFLTISNISYQGKLQCTGEQVLGQIVQYIEQLSPDDNVKVYYLDLRWQNLEQLVPYNHFIYCITRLLPKAILTLQVKHSVDGMLFAEGSCYYNKYDPPNKVSPDKFLLNFFNSIFAG